MKFNMGLCTCTINDDDIKYWENLTPPTSPNIVSDCVGVVMNDGSRYVYKVGTGLMFLPSFIKSHAFYESFRTLDLDPVAVAQAPFTEDPFN